MRKVLTIATLTVVGLSHNVTLPIEKKIIMHVLFNDVSFHTQWDMLMI